MTERDLPRHDAPPERALSVSRDSSPREQRVAQALELLEQGIESVMGEEGFAEYLHTLSRFHDYSFRNVLLIRAQRPDATRVAGYRKWRELGRQVQKGERGIAILVPHTVRDTDDLDAEGRPREKLVGFGVGRVFDVAQTEGKPFPTPPLPELLASESERGQRLATALERYATERGASVSRDARLPANGVYFPDQKRIVVNADLPGDQAVKTLCHEVAHFVADHTATIKQEDAETVAEASAFVVLHRFGLDSGQYSFPYIAAWAKERAVFERNLATIQRTSHELIDGLETLLLREPGREQTILRFSGTENE